DGRVKANRNDLCRAEVFILRPNLFDLDRLAGHLQRGQLGRCENFLDSIKEAAEVRAPIDCQPAVERALGHRARTQEFLKILTDSAAKTIACEWRVRTFHHFDRTFSKELF